MVGRGYFHCFRPLFLEVAERTTVTTLCRGSTLEYACPCLDVQCEVVIQFALLDPDTTIGRPTFSIHNHLFAHHGSPYFYSLTAHRKGVQKANAKFEPQAFRDQLVKHLESVPPGDYDAVASKLDALGSQVSFPVRSSNQKQ